MSETKSQGLSLVSKIHLGLRLAARILQCILAIAVVGLYASELGKTHDSPRYVFAVVVGALSALTSGIYLIPAVPTFVFFAWDALLFILWIAAFGSMGRYFIDPKTEVRADDHKMRNAVWVDLVNMLLWFMTAVAGGVVFMAHRRERRTLHTGRATV